MKPIQVTCLRGGLVLLLLALPGWHYAPAQTAAQDVPAEILSLQTQREVEQALLEEDRRSYPGIASKRRLAEDALARLHRALGRAVLAEAEEEFSAAQIEQIANEIERAEAQRLEAMQLGRSLVERIRNRKRRLELIDQALADRAGVVREVKGALDGEWRVVMLPAEQRGVFRLTQSGTVVDGTYELDGGWTGSLQGTLINNKVFLVRIDSRLGKSMEFEGRLSGDGTQILGTWLGYELADGKGSNGHWSARRVSRTGS